MKGKRFHIPSEEGWVDFGWTWSPEWRTGTGWAVTGLVKRWGLRLGPLGLYVLRLDNPPFEEFQRRKAEADKERGAP